MFATANRDRGRRRFLAQLGLLAAGAGVVGCTPDTSGPPALTLLVPSGPGGGWDQTARSLERALLQQRLADTVRVEHVPGGGGAVGLARFLGQPSAHQHLLVAGLVMVSALASSQSPLQLTDTVPIARLTSEYEVIAVHRDSPLQTIAELMALLRSDPRSVSWAGGAAGGTDHLFVAELAASVGVAPNDVSYVAQAGGGFVEAALLGEQVTCGVSGYGELADQIAAGSLRALAISAAEPVANINVPTLVSAGFPVALENWRGVFAAADSNASSRAAHINRIETATRSPAWQAALSRYQWTPRLLTGDAFEAFLAAEVQRTTELLTRVGLRQG